MIRRAHTLSPLERSVLSDPALSDSPLTVRHGEILTVSHSIPGSVLGPISVKLRAVHISATSTRNPHPAQLPAFILIHGLGGQLAQFDALVDFFAYYADVLALDLPGHGGAPYDSSLPSELYTTPSLVKLIIECIDAKFGSQREIVLVGHSLGCAIACHLALDLENKSRVRGLVAICPPAPLSKSSRRAQKIAKYVPSAVFDLFRYSDRSGGIYSPSVERMMGDFDGSSKDEEEMVRRRQLRWNLQVNTSIWLSMASGAEIPELADWQKLIVPCCFIAGDLDRVTSADNVVIIADAIQASRSTGDAEVRLTAIPKAGHMCLVDRHQPVCGVINDFIVACVDQRLSLGWQLADMATRDDKWSLKNEAKWRSVEAVSEPVGRSSIRAMKTLRQDDPEQNPTSLEDRYLDITDIIDISRDMPPYEPSSFKRITYHKFPTVSKIPPTRHQVDEFIALIDSIVLDSEGNPTNRVVGVHCHYGFNRTGFLICSYLVQKMGVPVRDAVEYFKQARPPGIKHPHFIDELYVRYTL
ncbi:Alpha/Beta hydrolase protein [Kockiozyma suomiensis]|uniref:Alpha/Beta hydrolase protein n=1 Tax=Kockiozyma suomiensis TaxID=1337062 RepID=UPI003342F4EC